MLRSPVGCVVCLRPNACLVRLRVVESDAKESSQTIEGSADSTARWACTDVKNGEHKVNPLNS